MSQEYQRRVRTEKAELDERIGKLTQFIETGIPYRQLDTEEQALLQLQRKLMIMYSEVLGERIEAFEDDGK